MTALTGMIFAGLPCAFILFFFLTKNSWISLLGAGAYAFSSCNIIYIQTGNAASAWAAAVIPLVLAGYLRITQKKYVTGGALFALGTALEWFIGHLQIISYLAAFCLILFIGYGLHCFFKKEFKRPALVLLTLCIALLPAGLTGMVGRHAFPEQNPPVARSYEVDETLSLLIPNIKGGVSEGILGQNSHLFREHKFNGERTGKEIHARTYWGKQLRSAGPVYFGASICFLFVLGMFVVKNKIKGWLLAAALLFIFLSWGNNFAWLNDWLIDIFPKYSRFQMPLTALLIPSLIFPLVAVWGLKTLFHHRNIVEKKRLKRQLLISVGITSAFCLILWLIPGWFYDFKSVNDKHFVSQVPDWYYKALLADREQLLKTDALRSLIIVLLSGAYLFFFVNKPKKQFNRSLIILVALVLLDLFLVDMRYIPFISLPKPG